LAITAYLVWNIQLNPYLSVLTLFGVIFNGGLVLFNLAPFFPLDGGRLVRVIVWGLLAQPARGTRLARRIGIVSAMLLAIWGTILVMQQARFSWPNGAGTLLFAALIFLPLLRHPGWQWNRPAPPRLGNRPVSIIVRGLVASLLIAGLLGITISLVPTNLGLEAPGIATDVTPMVDVPAEYRHPSAGQFLLTTVFSQTPITIGEWVVGQLSPVVRLVPPERIVPADETVQEVARRNFRMLDDSQMTAIAVGLQQAGYDATINGLGAMILAIMADSPAQNILQPGDVIVGVNGEPVETAAAVSAGLSLQAVQDSVQLQLERDGVPVTVTVPLLAPAEPEQPPRIGILLEDAGFETELPFPVGITPQKIVGGPSAGLMFTLTVYDLVTPQDLTGGRIIAGTGTINPDGTVGPIGGVQQKVAGAEFAGAEYFLSPSENFEDARTVARRIKVVEVASAAEAIQFLRSLPQAD
jgi:PDZ domain-containing protein